MRLNAMHLLNKGQSIRVELYVVASAATNNYRTGKSHITETPHTIEKAIFVPAVTGRQTQQPNFVKNRNFANASIFDMYNAKLHVKNMYLPQDYVANTRDMFVVNGKKYTIVKFVLGTDTHIFELELMGNQNFNLINRLTDRFVLSDTAECEVVRD